MSLGFLSVSPAVVARTPMADQARAAGAKFELRDGWEVACSYGDPAGEAAACASTFGFADVSHLRKTELQGALGITEFGQATWREGGWWCPLTPTRALLIGGEQHPSEGVEITSALGGLVLVGPRARDAFARFCALDLRERELAVGGWRPGSVARTPGYLLREGNARFLMLFGAAYGAYVWEVVADVAEYLGGRAVGVDVLAGLDHA